MIVGIGSDLVDIRRIERVLERHADRFIARVYTDVERSKAAHSGAVSATYAKRFAAKEACAKALGTGINRGVFFRDMGVVNLPTGQPSMALTGGAAERLASLVPSGARARVHVSMTDDYPMAQAFVVIEAVEG